MTDTPAYPGPDDRNEIGIEDVHGALAFLIAIEPDPDDNDIESGEDYEAYIAPFQADIARAMATLRGFAEHRQPQALIEMREVYYEFTNDDRYLQTAEMSGVVTSALRDAWDGVGPWRK